MSGIDKMQLFRTALRQRFSRIQRATYCDLELLLGERGEFTLLATWSATRAGPAGKHEIVFTRQRVLGGTANLPPRLQRLRQRTCRIADDVIRELQRVRGMA